MSKSPAANEKKPATASGAAKAAVRLAELRQELERERELIASGPVVLLKWLAAPGWPLEYVSPNAQEVLGRSAAGLVAGDPAFAKIIDPRDAGRVGREVRAHTAAGRDAFAHEPYRVVRPDGQVIWVLHHAVIMRDEAGRAAHYIGYIIDISQRMAAEAEAERSRQGLLLAQRLAKLGSWEWDLTRGTLTWSEETLRIFEVDLAKQTPSYELYLSYVHPDERDEIDQAMQRSVKTGVDYAVRHRLLMPDGRVKYIHGLGTVRMGPQGRAELIFGTVQDITEHTRLEHQRDLTAKVFANSIEGIIIADAAGRVELVNDAFTAITGFAPEDVIGQEMNVLRAGEHPPEFMQELWDGLSSKGQWSGEYWNRRKSGEAYPEWLTLNVIRDDQGHVTNYIAIFHDFTELKQSQDQIKFQAHHDALTGLPNRFLLRDRLRQALNQAKRGGGLVGLLFLDLDNFKSINDTLGHAQGDELLKEVAARLRGCVREEDTVARQGGDEFIVVLGALHRADDAVKVAQKVLAALAEPVSLDGRDLRVTASLGITIYPTDAEDADALIRNGDMAMYRAKERGRNQYQMFTEKLHQRVLRRLDMESGLRQALEREQITVHYQPRLDLGSGQWRCMEALVRWRRGPGDLVPPEEFIDVAEESGLIVPMGREVLRQACLAAQRARQLGNPFFMVSVNLSSRQFDQPDLPRTVEAVLEETGLPSLCLELEITENSVMRDWRKSTAVLQTLAEMGVQISLDDFGTGYSSLAYLKRFPISALKVDQSFVEELAADPNNTAIIEAIIAMGRSMDMRVVAEGVEQQAQLEFLRARRCDEAQGFLLARPAPLDQAMEILAAAPPF